MMMNSALPANILIKDVDSAKRDDFAVALALAPDGSTIIVSRFDDPVWHFYPYMPHESISISHKCIDWRIRLPGNTILTDPIHTALLYSSKEFIWSLFADPIEGRRRPSMSTLINRAINLSFLLRWMVDRGLTCFANLGGHTLAYAQAASIVRGNPASSTTLRHRLQLIEDLYAQRAKLDDKLQVHPWPGETISSLSGQENIQHRYLPTTDPIPDSIASNIANTALDYVRTRGQAILAARDAKDSAIQQMIEAGYRHDTIKRTRASIVRQHGYENARKLTTDINRLRISCYIVIDLFSGIRLSEVMSLSENCVSHRPSSDGSCDVIWLHGTIYKFGMRPKKWLVPPIVEEAITVLTQITAPLRKALRQEVIELRSRIPMTIGPEKDRLIERLTIAERQQSKLFLSKYPGKNNRISVLSSASIYNELRRFCVEHGISGDDGRPYPLHSHQFRRTYARFMARAELGDLLTLRDHFGHWSLGSTVYYTDGASDEYEADQELLDLISTEKQGHQIEVLRRQLESNQPLANGEHWLSQWRASVRTASNKEALIAEYAGAITINGTGHSWCVGNARGTGCGGLCVFEAQMCVDCAYGIIGQEHRAVWEGIRDQQREALALDDMGASGQERAQHILNIALEVIRRLDGEQAS